MSVSSLAASPAATTLPAPAANSAAPANDAAPGGNAAPANGAAPGPAVQVSLSAEAELTVSVLQETRITISATSGSKDGSAPTDPNTAHALSTLESVAAAQRAWIKALEANRDARRSPQASDASPQAANGNNGKSDAGDAQGQGPSVQISVEQDTVVQASLTVGAQLDVTT